MNKENKRGQAAMEFLMTYGWAILVVMVLVAALAYYGVTDQTDNIPQTCFFEAGLDCPEPAYINAQADTVMFMLINNKGSAIEVFGIKDDVDDDCVAPTMRGCAGTGCAIKDLPFTAKNNGKVFLEVNCTGTDIIEGRFKVNPTVQYNSTTTGFTRVAAGSITGRAT